MICCVSWPSCSKQLKGCAILEVLSQWDKLFQNHASVADATENEAPWTLVTHKSRTLLQSQPSNITTKTR